jgi:hypothetical protein
LENLADKKLNKLALVTKLCLFEQSIQKIFDKFGIQMIDTLLIDELNLKKQYKQKFTTLNHNLFNNASPWVTHDD